MLALLYNLVYLAQTIQTEFHAILTCEQLV